MRLVELEPRWIHENVFAFRCPHCKDRWLTCKNAVMTSKHQWEIIEAAFGEDDHAIVTASRPDFAWGISSQCFEDLTVTPSIDASNSGCWHGHITNGEIINC